MSKKNDKYWQKRFEALQEEELEKGTELYEKLKKQYTIAYQEIEKNILKWYNRFAKDNHITFAEAKKILSKGELQEFKWSLEEYIELASKNDTNILWAKELQNASTRIHISRLDTLRIQIENEIERIYKEQVEGMIDVAEKIYEDTYYHTAYELQIGNNVAWNLKKVDNKTIKKVLSYRWTDESNFSEKIWSNKDSLINTLSTGLVQNIIRGNGPDELIKSISKNLNTDLNRAGRLVMTESAFFANEAQTNCFKDLGVKRYKILGTLDSRTCEECGDMDLQEFDMADYEQGVTAPPFHPWCRCTKIPAFEDDVYDFGERAARDMNGKTYYVPGNMNYNEWKEKYVNSNPDEKKMFELKQTKEKNKSSDFEQYTRYKNIFGKELDKSFEEFQEMKYNMSSEYSDWKNYYRYKSTYPESNRIFYEINNNIKDLIKEEKIKPNIGTAICPATEKTTIGSINEHAMKKMTERDITKDMAQSYIDNSIIRFSQDKKMLYLSEEGATVLLNEDKRFITTYSKDDFNDSIKIILEVVRNGK